MQRKSGPQAYPTKDNAYKSPFARYQQLPINNSSTNQNTNRNNAASLAFNRISSDNSTQSFGDPLLILPGSRNQLTELHSRFRPPSPLLLEPEPIDIFSFNFDIIENDDRNGQTTTAGFKDKKKPQNKPVKHKIGKALPESMKTLDSVDQQGRQGDNVREAKKSQAVLEQDIPKEKANKTLIPANKIETKENIDIKEGLKKAILEDVDQSVNFFKTNFPHFH